MKLEIGPGKNKIGRDWVTMDMIRRPNVDIIWDIRNLPLPVIEHTYELVYMSHVLEHIPWTQTGLLLKEIHRILKPGGSIEIWVPDLAKLVLAYLDNTLIPKDGWYRFNPEKDPVKWFNGRMFTYGPGDENWHRTVFDASYLSRCLAQAGFRHVKKLDKPRGSDHGWINLGMSATR